MLPQIYVVVPTYVLMATIGLCVSLLFCFFRCDRVNIQFLDFVQYIVVCAVCLLFFARILFVIAIIPSLKTINLNNLLHYLFNGGIVFYGGLFGVIIGISIVSKFKKWKIISYLDFFAPAFPLFHFFARIGCILSGCCYGIPWTWGIIIQGENIVRFPVQFIESICNLFIFIFIEIYDYKTNGYKNNLAIYLCSYATCRFILEFFRGDNIRGIWFLGLSTAQYISLIILVTYMLIIVIRFYKRHN